MISKWPCAFHLPAVKILVLPSWSGAPNYLSGFVGEKYRLYLNEPPYIDRLSVGWEGPIPTDRWGYGQSFFLVVIRSSDWSWRQILVFFPTPSWVVYISITNTAIPLFWGGWIPSQKVKALSTFCSHTRLYSWPPRPPGRGSAEPGHSMGDVAHCTCPWIHSMAVGKMSSQVTIYKKYSFNRDF